MGSILILMVSPSPLLNILNIPIPSNNKYIHDKVRKTQRKTPSGLVFKASRLNVVFLKKVYSFIFLIKGTPMIKTIINQENSE